MRYFLLLTPIQALVIVFLVCSAAIFAVYPGEVSTGIGLVVFIGVSIMSYSAYLYVEGKQTYDAGKVSRAKKIAAVGGMVATGAIAIFAVVVCAFVVIMVVGIMGVAAGLFR